MQLTAKLIKSNTVTSVFNNTFYQLIGKVVSMSITILATIIITRYYGRTGFGEFNLMQSIPALFFIIADFGFNAIAARELSKNYDLAQKYLGTILLLRVFVSIILMLLVGMSLVFFPYSPELKFGIYLSLFLILTQALYSTTNIIFQVKLRYDLSTIGYVIGSVVVLFLVLILSYFKASIVWVNFSYVVGGITTFLINIYFIKKYLSLNIKLSVDKMLLKTLFIQAMPLGLMFIFSQINFKADSILLSLMPLPKSYGHTNIDSVAIYGLPYKIFEVALVIPTFFMNSMYPIFVKHLLKGKVHLKTTFIKAILTLLIFGTFSFIIGYIFSPFAISILGGREFSESSTVLRILLIGLPIFFVTQPLAWLIVTLNKQKYLPGIYFISALFNFVSNIILIPKYSFYASAYLTWLSEIVILLFLVIFARKAWREYA